LLNYASFIAREILNKVKQTLEGSAKQNFNRKILGRL
jgi:hypothetical protein